MINGFYVAMKRREEGLSCRVVSMKVKVVDGSWIKGDGVVVACLDGVVVASCGVVYLAVRFITY